MLIKALKHLLDLLPTQIKLDFFFIFQVIMVVLFLFLVFVIQKFFHLFIIDNLKLKLVVTYYYYLVILFKRTFLNFQMDQKFL